MVISSEPMSMQTLESEITSDEQIAADFLSYLQCDSSDRVAYEVEPTRLTGGFDARLYRYKLVGQEPRVLRILRPAREVKELLHLQLVHQILNHQSGPENSCDSPRLWRPIGPGGCFCRYGSGARSALG